MEQVLGTCLDRGIKVVTNAGGLNPRRLAPSCSELAERLGLDAASPTSRATTCCRLDELRRGHDSPTSTPARRSTGRSPVTANAYLGGWGIAAALDAGADVVVTGRVTDAVARRRARPRGGTAGPATTGTRSPARSSPGT